jgi:hypothetical protein
MAIQHTSFQLAKEMCVVNDDFMPWLLSDPDLPQCNGEAGSHGQGGARMSDVEVPKAVNADMNAAETLRRLSNQGPTCIHRVTSH